MPTSRKTTQDLTGVTGSGMAGTHTDTCAILVNPHTIQSHGLLGPTAVLYQTWGMVIGWDMSDV